MALARRLAMVAVVVVMLALPASAAAKLEFNLPAQIFKVFDESGKSANDQGRCQAVVFVEFPKIKRAVGYRIVVRRTDLDGQPLVDYVAPPFETDGRGFTARFPPPRGFARFFVGAYSSPNGCADADARTEGPKIEEAKVSLDRRFQKRFRDVETGPWQCAHERGERTVTLTPGGDRLKVIVRRQGRVMTFEKGSNQPLNLMTNRFAEAGTIVRTGPNSVVSIASLSGESVLVGPGTTVRITDTGFKILEAGRSPLKVLRKPGPYKVRTGCGGAVAARG